MKTNSLTTCKEQEKPSQLTREIHLLCENVDSIRNSIDRLEARLQDILSPVTPKEGIPDRGNATCKLHESIRDPNSRLALIAVDLESIFERIQL